MQVVRGGNGKNALIEADLIGPIEAALCECNSWTRYLLIVILTSQLTLDWPAPRVVIYVMCRVAAGVCFQSVPWLPLAPQQVPLVHLASAVAFKIHRRFPSARYIYASVENTRPNDAFLE